MRKIPFIFIYSVKISTLQKCVFLATFAVLLTLSSFSDAYAATISVDGDMSCDDVTGTPYCTIQAAVNNANAGDIISIAPGTYAETLNVDSVNNNLTLQGNSKTDTFVTGGVIFSGNTDITGVTIKNLNISGGTGTTISQSGTNHVRNVTFDNNKFDGKSTTGFSHYLNNIADTYTFTNNEVTGYTTWGTIYMDDALNSDSLVTLTFDNNNIHDNVGSSVFRGHSTNFIDNVYLRNNQFNNNGNHDSAWAGFEVHNSDNTVVTGNTFSNHVKGAGLYFTQDNAATITASVTGNTFDTNAQGVRLFSGNVGGITLNDNVFSENTAAVSIRDDTSKSAFATGTLDARDNYWGHATGPIHADNPHTTPLGNPITGGTVTVLPWHSTSTTTSSTRDVSVTHSPNGIIANSDTIQGAIDSTLSGDTITVSAGTYSITSSLLIDKPLTLLGPQANVDPRTAAVLRTAGNDSSEAIIMGPDPLIENLLIIDSDDVTINGFEITHGGGDLIKSEGDVISNPIVKYNLIHDSNADASFIGDEGVQLKDVDNGLIQYNHVFDTTGDGINFARSHDSTIQFNEVHNVATRVTASGIYVYNVGVDIGFGNEMNVLIENNLVYNVIINNGIELGDRDGTDVLTSGARILNNVVHDTKQDSISVKASNVVVEGNDISRSASRNGAIYVDFSPDDITIKNNIIRDNGIATINGDEVDDGATTTTYGIRIGKTGTDAATNVKIIDNKISGNESGMFYNFQTGGAVIDATNNYWGSEEGPVNPSNPDGAGDTVEGDNVLFDPWYINEGLSALKTEVDGTKITPTSDNVTFDDGDDTQEVKGQASLPQDIVEIALNDDSVLDFNDNIEEKVGDDIDVGGITTDLATFEIQSDDDDTTTTSVATDLTETQTVANVDIIVEKAVKLESGTDTQPIIITNVDLPTVEVSIPDETTILAPSGWTGTIQPPKAGSSSGTAPSGFSVGGNVIEVGSPDAVLLFDTPVTITLEGVTGSVGYKPSGSSTWTQITEQCGGTFADPDAPAAFPGECFISNGVDTKISTYHFTTFGGLSTSISGGGGSGDKTKPVLQSNSLSSPDSNIFGGTLKLDDSASNSASIFETGDTVDLELSFYENNGVGSFEHITLFTDIRGFEDRYDSELYVEWNKDKPLKVFDSDGYLDGATDISFTERDGSAVMVFHLNFVKPMDVSNIVLNFWDYKRNSGLVTFEDAIVIVQPVDTIVDGIIADSEIDGDITPDDFINDSTGTSQEESTTVPTWIKGNAGWWADGTLEDDTFTSGIQYLIQEKIIDVPSLPNVSADPDAEIIEAQQQEIPKWIKNSAQWWSEDMISEDEFLSAIQWLIANGIIII